MAADQAQLQILQAMVRAISDLKSTDTIVNNGPTDARPTAPSLGETFFDTTLGMPIWYTGIKWVDATGTAA